MRLLSESEVKKYFDEAVKEAIKSECLRSKCGAVIIKNGEIIGRGFNSPPNNLESQRKCLYEKDSYNKKITDKTCCIHAEQRAILDALRNNPEKIKDSDIYFIRIDKNGMIRFSEKPYCTICSKMALDNQIKNFILWHENGICSYNTEEYNLLSYNYGKN